MTGPRDPGQPGWGQPGGPGQDPTRAFPQPGPWTGASPPPPYRPPQGQPPHGPPPHAPPPVPPHQAQGGYGYDQPAYGYDQPAYGPPPGQQPPGGFPPEIGGRGRGPLIGGLAAVLVLLLVVLGVVLLVRSRDSSPAPVAGAVSTTPAAPPSASAPPPRPSSIAPSTSRPAPTTTAAPSTSSGSGSASSQDTQQISALGERLVKAISAGDQPTLQSIACARFAPQLAKFTSPTDPPVVYDHTEGVSVTGDDGTAQVFAADGSATPSPQKMTVQRTGGAWKVCGLGGA